MNQFRSSRQPGRRNAGSGPGASSGEMARFPRSNRPSRERDEPVLDMILDRVPPPPETPPQMAALPPLLADLSGPAEPGELAMQAAVLSRFRSRVRPAGTAPPARRKPLRRLAPHGPRLAAGLVVAAVGLGGTAAAYAGALPGPLQDFAHRMIDAPAASDRSGVVPGHKPGVAPAVPGSGHQTPRPAAPGPASDRGTTRNGTHPGATARPAEVRRSGEPSPRPAQRTRPTTLVHPTSPGKPVPPTPTQPVHRTHLPARS